MFLLRAALSIFTLLFDICGFTLSFLGVAFFAVSDKLDIFIEKTYNGSGF